MSDKRPGREGEGREEKSLAVPERANPTNPDLMWNGDPAPQALPLRNLVKYGFTCPRREYIESPEAPVLREMAARWSVRQSTISNWKSKQKWDAERRRFWGEVLARQQDLIAGDMGNLRARELTARLSFWRALRAAMGAIAEKGYIEEVSPTGGKIERGYNPKDLKDMASVAEKIDAGLDRTLGFTKAMLREEDDEEAGTVKSVREVVYREVRTETRVPKVEAPQAATPPALEGETIEGEISPYGEAIAYQD